MGRLVNRFAPGETIVERHVMFNAVVVARPQIVVADDGDVLASFLPIGTKHYGPIFADRAKAVDEFTSGTMKWGIREWVDHDVLILVRPGDAYSAQAFWNAEGRFVCWYINLQEPMRRTDLGYDSRDGTLDLIVGEDLATWMWKDEHELAAGVEIGLHTAEEAEQIRAAGEAVIGLVERGETWWGDWRDWTPPDPSWPIPSLPDGWDTVAPA
jgi:hypothetical protein